MFSPVNADFEQRAAEIVRAELPELAISLSHEIGRIGLLERENAALLRASVCLAAGSNSAGSITIDPITAGGAIAGSFQLGGLCATTGAGISQVLGTFSLK